MEFLGGMILGGIITFFVMELITAGKDDENDD